MKLFTNYNIGDVIKFEDEDSGMIYFGEVTSLEVYCDYNDTDKIGIGYVLSRSLFGPNCKGELDRIDKNQQIIVYDTDESEYFPQTGYKFLSCYANCTSILRTCSEPRECNNNSDRR